MKKKDPRIYNIISIICGAWFILTGSVWIYFANLVVSYPVALVGILLWNKGRRIDPENRLNKTALILHIAGVTLSLVSLVVLLLTN